MKDIFKRGSILLLGLIILVAICYVFVYFYEKNDDTQLNTTIFEENQITNNTQETIESDTDIIENYNNTKARCTSNLNLREEPSTER